MREANPKVYRPPYWKVSVTLSILMLIAGLYLLIGHILRLAGLSLVVIPGRSVFGTFFLLAVGIPLFFSSTRKRILIYPDRLEYYAMGYRIRVAWADVVKVEKPEIPWWMHLRGGTRRIGEWLVLRRAFMSGSWWAKAWLRFSGYGQLVPITDFGLNWRESELGDDIRQYAPQLDI